jgi:hypothetical protein
MFLAIQLLGLIALAVFVTCYLRAIRIVFTATRTFNGIRQFFWRGLVLGLPLGGFLVFALTHKTTRTANRQWVIVHVLLLVLGLSANRIVRHLAVIPVDAQQRHDYRSEWWSQNGQRQRPELCLALSGGGIRSAAFSMGVLQALHNTGLLDRVDVVSGVSGGSYTLAWFLLQQVYHSRVTQLGGPRVLDQLFDPTGKAQQHLATNARQFGAESSFGYVAGAAEVLYQDLLGFNVLRAISWTNGEHGWNSGSSARRVYRDSLQTTFQLAVSPSNGEPMNRRRVSELQRDWEDLTNQIVSIVEPVTFRELATFAKGADLPFFVFNATVDAAPLPDNVLWPAVFELNGWGLGSDSYGYASWTDVDQVSPRYTEVRLANVAPAMSGAAISAFAETRSWFRAALVLANADLGYLIPRFKSGDRGSMFVSDGGHSENLGLYALVRRNCERIVVVDAEYEPTEPYSFVAYHKVKRALLNEARQVVDVAGIDRSAFDPANPVMRGTIASPTASTSAELFYMKLAMDKRNLDKMDYPATVKNRAVGIAFPQDPTTDQDFDELRYNAYRDLGCWIATHSKAIDELVQRFNRARIGRGPDTSRVCSQ